VAIRPRDLGAAFVRKSDWGFTLNFRSLNFQISALALVCLLVALFVSGAYVANQRAEDIEEGLRRDAQMLGRELATNLSIYLVVNDYISLEQALRFSLVSSALRELAVTDPRGNVLSQVRLGGDGQLHPRFQIIRLAPPVSGVPEQEIVGESLITWSPARVSDTVGWVRVVSDMGSVVENKRKIYSETALVGGVAFLIAMTVLLLFLRPRLRALRDLANFARGITLSRGASLPVTHLCEEIEVLGATLNETADRLAGSARNLSDSEARLRAVVENMPVMLIAFDNNNVPVAWNKECERVTGYTRDEIIQDPQLLRWLLPDGTTSLDMPEVTAQFGDVFHNVELSCVAKNGGVRVISWSNISGEFPIPGWRVWAVGADVTERVETERLKDDFVTTINHELRTPLTAIRGALGLIRGGLGGELPAAAKNLVEMADRNSERLLLLISNILDVQKIGSGHLNLAHQPVDVGKLVRDALEINAPLARHAAVELVLQNDAAGAWVEGDAAKLEQVLTNLVSNAVKHSARNSEVDVRIDWIDSFVRVSVRDHGAGVPEHFHAQVFERFKRAPEDQAAQISGSGLGLYISRRIIEQHGGRIGFTSPSGQGALFFFELPACAIPSG